MSVIAIDFDGVLHDIDHPKEGRRMGEPIDGAATALEFLYDEGHEIVIHTVRAETPQSTQVVEAWLDWYEIPYSRVTNIKPNADAFIDDRGLTFTDWLDVLATLHRRQIT